MSELEKLKQRQSRRRSQLEDARRAFDLEAIEYLKEEIHELESCIAALEGEVENANSISKA